MQSKSTGDTELVCETSLWILIKEWFLNRRKIELIYFVSLHRKEEINEIVKLFDWVRENLIGRWQIRIYTMPNSDNLNMAIIAKFNREEDAVAFKLRWM